MRKWNRTNSGISRREFLLAGSAAALAGTGIGRAALAASPQKTHPASFPADFLWGVSTSAYQIEGATREDGRGPSIWDVFVKKPGAIYDGQTGDLACDHYHRWAEDISLMKDLGLKTYRFSVSWPRVLPEGAGDANEKGIDFYDRLVDALLDAGIVPIVTLFHWDLPQALHERGGWRNRDSADWFANFADLVTQRLSDRATLWLTLNEVRSFVGAGYRLGIHAPGEQLPLGEALQVGHNLFRAHGLGAKAIRARARQPVQLGIALDFSPSLPATGSPADEAAARVASFAGAPPREGVETWWAHNAWWLDPVYLGRYPEEALSLLGKDVPEVRAGDLELIRQPLDFFALNLYGGWPVRAGADGKPEAVPFPPGAPLTAFNWQVVPDSLFWGPRFLFDRYKLPILVTENGLTCRDWVALDGGVHDPDRIDFTARYLLALRRAMEGGVPVRGYCHWTLLDNFEWAAGYRERFGMVYVDFTTEKRVPKDSARWYAKLIASNGESLPR